MTPQEAIDILYRAVSETVSENYELPALIGRVKEAIEKQIPDDIYEKAVIKFGKTPQLIMAMEEMSELIQALSKDIRGKHNENNISEEIADVEIMLAQLKIIYQNDAEVKKWKTDKLFRLQARIEEV